MKTRGFAFLASLLGLASILVGAQAFEEDDYLLAKAYLGASAAGMLADLARSGITIHTPDAVITSENADQFSKANEEQAARYAEEIQMRGFQDLSGAYTGTATKACSKIQSMWAALIQQEKALKIEIVQQDFEGNLGLATEDVPDKMFENRIAVAGNSIALIDFINSDYFFQGTVEGNAITFRPDLASLSSWPGWVDPPKKKDLQQCVVTLTRIP